MDFRPERAITADFEARHRWLSTSPDSGFVRTFAVQRRDATGVDMLRGCVLSRLDGKPLAPRTLETEREWYEALRDVFDLPLTDLTAAERARLWARVRGAHERWLAGRDDVAREERP
jgi:N-hydroxyarylamine O-acetyltransferase